MWPHCVKAPDGHPVSHPDDDNIHLEQGAGSIVDPPVFL